VLWDQGVFGIGRNTFDELVREADRADYAVFVAKADDRVTVRGETRGSLGDNIVFEMGLFAGRLGIENTCIVACRDDEVKLPTDLAGITLATYPRRQDDNWRATVEPVIEPIRQALNRSSKSR
jgi:CRP/FNR family cyclic AMP-dependent transcriptional regulator